MCVCVGGVVGGKGLWSFVSFSFKFHKTFLSGAKDARRKGVGKLRV